MEYKLLEKLQEAGFELVHEAQTRYHSTEVINGIEYYIPTLEELIEACGEEFGSLEQVEIIKYYDDGQTKRYFEWYVTATVPLHDDKPGAIKYITGKTPSEAIARLWLTVNKNKS